MKTKIKLNRFDQRANKLRKYRVFIGNVEQEPIKNGETKYYFIPGGHHEIQLKIDWCRSKKIKFKTYEESVKEFYCYSNISGWKYVFYMLFSLFPNTVVAISE